MIFYFGAVAAGDGLVLVKMMTVVCVLACVESLQLDNSDNLKNFILIGCYL